MISSAYCSDRSCQNTRERGFRYLLSTLRTSHSVNLRLFAIFSRRAKRSLPSRVCPSIPEQQVHCCVLLLPAVTRLRHLKISPTGSSVFRNENIRCDRSRAANAPVSRHITGGQITFALQTPRSLRCDGKSWRLPTTRPLHSSHEK